MVMRRPHRGIDRVLTTLSTGEGRERQDAVFVAGHVAYRGWASCCASIAGLVDGQDISACGLIDGSR